MSHQEVSPRSSQGQALEVLRIRTKETLCRPAFARLIMRGARACGFPVPAEILAELCLNPGDPKTGIFVGLAEAEPQVVAIGFLPCSAFWLAASVSLAYSEGASHELVRTVGAKLRQWFQKNGYDHVHVANLSHTDRAYMRAMKHFGRGTRIGSAIEFRFD